jgi:TonB family protein
MFTMPGGAGPTSNFGARQTVDATMAWPEAPSYSAVAAGYPKKARANKVGGRATLNCDFNKEGRLSRCDTVTEEPRGQGFADAAKTLAKQFRAFTTTSSGEPLTRASVHLPVTFDPAMLTDAKPVIGKAKWAGLPSAEDTRAAFAKVEAGHGTVRVLLACVVQQGGGVSDCAVQREEPAGVGVGQAALALAPRFRLSTWTAEGLPTVGGTVSIPLRYEGGVAAPAPAAKP